MVFQKLFLEIKTYIKIFFVSFLINSTEGWLNGFMFNDLPNKIVSKIKKQNSSPKVCSSLLSISKLLKGIFFF